MAKMAVIREIRHPTTFGGGKNCGDNGEHGRDMAKLQSAPGADNPRYAAVAISP